MDLHIERITQGTVEDLKTFPGNHQSFNEEFFKDGKNILLIAQSNDSVVGFLIGYLLLNPQKRLPEIFIYEIETYPAFRRKKVASKLLSFLLDIAKMQGCKEIFLLTEKDNRVAIQFYENTGGKRDLSGVELFTYHIK